LYYAYDINHPFGLNVKYAAFHIFPSVDIREMEVKLNTGKKDKDIDNDKSNEEKNSRNLFTIIAIIILSHFNNFNCYYFNKCTYYYKTKRCQEFKGYLFT